MTSTTSSARAPSLSVNSGMLCSANLLRLSAVLALLATIARSVHPLALMIHQPGLIVDYLASLWWLDYADVGFVRRGLPGQMLALLSGGAPSAAQVAVAGLAVTAAAIVALVWLAWALARRSAPDVRLAVATLVVASPFGVGVLVRGIGGYDGIGVCALTALVAVAGHRRAAPVVAVLAVLVAGLSEEVLVVFAAPVAVLVVAAGRSGWQRVVVPAAVVAPGVVATIVSCLVQPTVHDLAAVEEAAHAARPDIVPGQVTAIAALWQTAGQAVGHVALMKWWVLPLATVVLATCFVMSIALLWHFLGRPAPFLRYAGWFALAALALSFIGVDYQRWWSLAFISSVAVLALVSHSPGRSTVTLSRPLVVLVAVVLAVGVAGQLGPINAEKLDRSSGVAIRLPPSP